MDCSYTSVTIITGIPSKLPGASDHSPQSHLLHKYCDTVWAMIIINKVIILDECLHTLNFKDHIARLKYSQNPASKVQLVTGIHRCVYPSTTI